MTAPTPANKCELVVFNQPNFASETKRLTPGDYATLGAQWLADVQRACAVSRLAHG